jgi:uncharacterized protein
MHINVSDLLVESIGYSRPYVITDEWPVLEGTNLASAVNGQITITRLDAGVAVRGHATTDVELQCDRCLCMFTSQVTLPLKQLFTAHPGDDELPLDHGVIDLSPLIEQEIVLALPIKSLCRPECAGLKNLLETKGTPSGRTQET